MRHFAVLFLLLALPCHATADKPTPSPIDDPNAVANAPTPALTAPTSARPEATRPEEPASRAPHLRVAAWLTLDLAVLSTAGAFALQVAAAQGYTKLQNTCAPNCTSSQTSEARAFATSGYVLAVVAGAAAVTSLAIAILSRHHQSTDARRALRIAQAFSTGVQF